MAQANCVPSADCVPIPAGTVETSTKPITAAYAGLLPRPADHSPRSMLVAVGRAYLLERAADLRQPFTAFLAYVGALLHDTNNPRVLDREIEALMPDLIAEVTGTLHSAAAAEVVS